MTLTTPYSATFIVGDGETKTFSYLFEEVSPNFISVMVYNSLTGLISTPTYIIDTDQKQVIFGDDTPAPTADETVCIYRNTPNVQDVAFRTLHGYDAQTLENILSKIVAMIQEIKSNYFSTQVLQGDPWQLDLLSSADDGATVNIDYTAKKLVKGLYFKITSGNLQVSADGVTYITLPKSDDVAEFRQYEQTLPDLTVIHKLQYRVGNQWFDAEANAQYTADSAYSLAESVQTDLSAHVNNQNNPHNVTKSQVGLGNVDNTSDLNKPISTAVQTALNAKVNSADLATVATTGSYTDLLNKPTIPTVNNPTITFIQGGTSKGSITLNQSTSQTIAFDAGGGGAVDSVNGQTGTVVLTASDVGALPDSTVIPAAQVNSDWNANSGVAQILNKPTLGSAAAASTSDFATAAQGNKADSAVQPGDLATVATTGSYSDLSNKPTIPAAQVNSDWNASSGVAEILNKPTIPTVNNPTITITQGGVTKGSFTLNQASGDTIALDAGGGGGLPSQTGNSGKFLTTDGTNASWGDALKNESTASTSLLVKQGSGSALSVGNSVGFNNTMTAGYSVGISGSVASAYGTGIGYGAYCGGTGGGYGVNIGAFSAARKLYSVALGAYSESQANHAIQIGCIDYNTKGINSDANTFKVANANGNFEIMSADGTIPTDRYTTTPVADGTYVPTLTISSGTATRTWGAPSGGLPSQTGHSGEFLTTNGTTASWATVNAMQIVDYTA